MGAEAGDGNKAESVITQSVCNENIRECTQEACQGDMYHHHFNICSANILSSNHARDDTDHAKASYLPISAFTSWKVYTTDQSDNWSTTPSGGDHMVVRGFLTVHKMVEAQMQLVYVPHLAPHPYRPGAHSKPSLTPYLHPCLLPRSRDRSSCHDVCD